MKKKLTKKSLVLSGISLLAACLLFVTMFVGAMDMLPIMVGMELSFVGVYGLSILGLLTMAFMATLALYAVVLVLLNLLAYTFGDKGRTAVQLITVISALVLTPLLFTSVAIGTLGGLVYGLAYAYSEEVLIVLFSYFIYYLITFAITVLPVLLSLVCLIAYCVLRKKLPDECCEEKVAEPVVEEVTVVEEVPVGEALVEALTSEAQPTDFYDFYK